MANFQEIDKVRKVLVLGDTATLEEVKQAYRRMAFQHHPDKGAENDEQDEEMMKKLNWAYELLIEYCSNYSCSFKEEAVAKADPCDQCLKKYHYGWFEGI